MSANKFNAEGNLETGISSGLMGHLGSYADFTLPYLKLGHYKLNSFGDCCLKYFLILSCSFLTVGI